MSAEWFYLKGKDRCGPFTTAEMKRLAAMGQLSKDDVVWKTGVAGSIRAGRVRGLFPGEAPEPPPPPKAAESEGKDAAASDVKTAAVVLLGALARRAKDATNEAIEAASQHRNKVRADPSRDKTPSRAHPPQPRTARKKRRLLLKLFLVCGILSACGVGLIVSGVVSPAYLSDYIRFPPAASGNNDRLLKSFDQHPPPILESIKAGKTVWLLEDYRSDANTGKHKSHKEALYVVFDDGDLEYVVLKTHHDPIESKEMFKKNREVDTWEQMRAGEEPIGQDIHRTWKGREESSELARLEYNQRFEDGRNPDHITTHTTDITITLRWNNGGTKTGWESSVSTTARVKTLGKELSRHYQKDYKGFGQLLRQNDRPVQRSSCHQRCYAVALLRDRPEADLVILAG